MIGARRRAKERIAVYFKMADQIHVHGRSLLSDCDRPRSRLERGSANVGRTVDVDGRPGGVPRAPSGEERRDVRHVLGRRHLAQRNFAENRVFARAGDEVVPLQ